MKVKGIPGKLLSVLLLTALVVGNVSIWGFAAAPADFEPKGIVIGNPFSDKPAYARNVWDMQVFDGKIYFGYGNWSNTSKTAHNAGPVSIYSLHPETDIFSKEYSNIPEEAIDAFKVIDNKLYVPGIDSRESWNYGNFYTLEQGSLSWKKQRTIPGGVHVFNINEYNGTLYAGIGVAYTDPNYPQSQLVSSSDGGATWMAEALKNPLSPPSRNYMPFFYRITSLFQLGGNLYGSEYIRPTNQNSYQAYFIQVAPGAKSMVPYSPNFVPGASLNTNYVMRRQVNFQDKLLFILFGNNGDSDGYQTPFSLYAASSISSGTKITLPQAGALPMDIITRNNVAYVLAYLEGSNTNFTNIVYQTTDLNNWTEAFRFHDVTFARSFEEINGDFYFGMGAKDVAVPSSSSGNIIKIKSLH